MPARLRPSSGEGGDFQQPGDVVLAVAPGAAGAAGRFEQALAFPDAQGLGLCIWANCSRTP